MGGTSNARIQCACGCGQELAEFDRWGRRRKFISGHNGRKYDDKTQYKREWNHRNREKRYEYRKQYYRKKKAKLLNHFGGKCVSCGIEYDGKNACIFHFHHREASKKIFEVGNQITNKAWATIIKEVAKCDMLCANCHEKRHSEEF